MPSTRLFSLRARSRRILAATMQPAVFAVLLSQAQAGQTWDGGGTNDNWNTPANWSGDSLPAYGTLTFSGAVRTTNSNNSITAMNQLLWTGSSAWTMNGTVTLSLFDNGGTQAKLENQSTGSVTINAPITFAANNGSPPNPFGEITALNGDMTFASGTLTVNGSSVNGIKFWGGAGRTVNFNSTVNASGKWFGITSSAGTNVTIGTGANVTVGDIYVMNNGKLNLSGGTLTTSAIRLGGDFGNTGNQNQTLGGTLVLTPAAGGLTVPSTINTVTGNTSNALLIDSQNTSGTNTISGSVFLDTDLRVQQAVGGTLSFAGSNSIDVKIRKLTVAGAGTVSIAEVLGSSFGAGGFVVKEGVGTLILAGTANNYTGTNAATLNANGTQIAAGTLGIHGDGSLGLAPGGAYNNIQFTGSATLQDTANDISLHANRNIGIAAAATATLDNNGNTFTVHGIINGATGSLATTGGGAVVLTGANTYAGATSVNGGTLQLGNGGTSGSISSTSSITVASGATLAVNRSDTLTITQGIQGNGGLRKLGSGVLVLSGANTYSGGTEINEGILRVGAANSLPTTGAIILANTTGAALDLNGNNTLIGSLSGGGTNGGHVTLGNATLTVGDSANTTFGGIISGTGGSVVKQGSGVITLTNSSTYTGSTTINAGAIRNGTNNALPPVTALFLADAASVLLDLDGFSQTVGSLAGGGANGGMIALGSGTLTVGDSSNTTFGGTIAGTGGSLVKQGSGTLTLANANSYTGHTTVSAGILSVGHAGALGTTASGTTVSAGGALELPGGLVLDGEGLTLHGDGGSGHGALRAAGTSTVQNAAISLGSASTIKVAAGLLTIAASSPIIGNNLALTLGGNGDTTIAAPIDLGTGGLIKNDSGTLTLGGANTFSSLTVSGGAVQVSADTNLGTAGGSIAFTGTGALHATETFAANRPLVLNASASLDIASTKSVTWSGQVSGTAGLTKSGAGTLVLTGNNTAFTGALAINGGAVNAASSQNLGDGSATNSLTIDGGTLHTTASFDLGSSRPISLSLAGGTIEVDSSTTLIASGSISGNGSLTKTGGGTLTISGHSNNYAGATLINAGTLFVANNFGSATGSGPLTVGSNAVFAGDGAVSGHVTVLDDGTLRPGASIGTLELGALTFSDGARLSLEIDTSALLADIIAVSNIVPGDGDLTLNGTVTLDITDLDPGTLEPHDAIVFATYTGERLGSGYFRVPGFDYDLLDYTGDDLTATYFFLGGTPMAIDYDYNNTKSVAFVVVPEPGALTALAAGTALLLGLRRLRRRAA